MQSGFPLPPGAGITTAPPRPGLAARRGQGQEPAASPRQRPEPPLAPGRAARATPQLARAAPYLGDRHAGAVGPSERAPRWKRATQTRQGTLCLSDAAAGAVGVWGVFWVGFFFFLLSFFFLPLQRNRRQWLQEELGTSPPPPSPPPSRPPSQAG